jgi:hypothetical protein
VELGLQVSEAERPGSALAVRTLGAPAPSGGFFTRGKPSLLSGGRFTATTRTSDRSGEGRAPVAGIERVRGGPVEPFEGVVLTFLDGGPEQRHGTLVFLEPPLLRRPPRLRARDVVLLGEQPRPHLGHPGSG